MPKIEKGELHPSGIEDVMSRLGGGWWLYPWEEKTVSKPV